MEKTQPLHVNNNNQTKPNPQPKPKTKPKYNPTENLCTETTHNNQMRINSPSYPLSFLWISTLIPLSIKQTLKWLNPKTP